MKARRWLVAGLLLALLLQGLFHVYALHTDGDSDGAHLHHGWLVLRGELNLYGDSHTGHRTPLAYWWIGLSQLLYGPSLVAGRLVSLAAGLAGVVILWRAAHVALGARSGLIALCLMATQAYVLSHFAIAAFAGLAFFWVAGFVWFLLASESPWRHAWMVLCLVGLVMTRPQFGGMLFIVAVWAVSLARGRERWAVLVALLVPLGAFWLVFWPWKMLAYIPLTEGLAARWGYIPAVLVGDPDWTTRIGRAAVLILRSYKAWLALAVACWAIWPVGFPRLPERARWAGWLFGTFALTQLLLTNVTWKVAVGYFPIFAFLAVIPLAARVEQCLAMKSARWATRIMPTVLALALLAGPLWSPPPGLPASVDSRNPPAIQMQRAARELRRMIPEGTPVFLFGPATVLHEAGLRPPIQPSNHLETLQGGCGPEHDVIRRSGLWCASDISFWLESFTLPATENLPEITLPAYPWAILWRDGLVARVEPYSWQAPAAQMLALLDRFYAYQATVAYHGIRLEVWRRKA